jgi:hypothetical protein
MTSPRCFVIGPMSGDHMATLNWLAYDVVKSLLPDGFVVQTPDLAKPGNIMKQVVQCCDRATLVIANVTGNNPNVLYEIAALDAMGRACIPVMVIEDRIGTAAATQANEDKSNKDQRIAFDRAAYRIFNIYRSDSRRQETNQIMSDVIRNTLDQHYRGDKFDNPLTDFYGVPLSSFSSAYGLARTYFINLIVPAIGGISEAFRDKSAGNHVFDSACDFRTYRKGQVQIVMPRKLDHATRRIVQTLLDLGYFKPVTVRAYGRSVTLYEWIRQDDPTVFKWVDVPTIISSLRDVVCARLGSPDNCEEDPEFPELSKEEIDRFQKALVGRIFGQGSRDELRPFFKSVDWISAGLPSDL